MGLFGERTVGDPPLDWEINGNFLTTWISDLELLAITPADNRPGSFELTYSRVTDAASVRLGVYAYLESAKQAAEHQIKTSNKYRRQD